MLPEYHARAKLTFDGVNQYMTSLEKHIYWYEVFAHELGLTVEQIGTHDASKYGYEEFAPYVRKFAMGIDDSENFMLKIAEDVKFNKTFQNAKKLPFYANGVVEGIFYIVSGNATELSDQYNKGRHKDV